MGPASIELHLWSKCSKKIDVEGRRQRKNQQHQRHGSRFEMHHVGARQAKR